MKKIVAAMLGVLVAFTLPNGVAPSLADTNSPPDESVNQEQGAEEQEAAKKRDEEAHRAQAAAARKRAAEEAARKKAAAKRAAEAERAAAAKRAAEDERRAASADMIATTLAAGRNLVENGRYRSAIMVLRSFLDAHPDYADAWYLISRAHHALGDYDKAQAAANVALEIDPYYPDLVKTPNGIQPMPVLTKQQSKEPRPSMSVLPVKPPLPANLLLEPVVISFPILVRSEHPGQDGFANSMYEPDGRDSLTGAYLQYVPYPPLPLGATVSWMQSEKFNEISRWRFRVDRMGMLMEPRVPIAWKGSHPYEIYFWTGDEWARVRRENKNKAFQRAEAYDDILNSARDSIAEVLRDRGFVWHEPDTPALAASASHMRYRWMGDIDLMDAEFRADERAREHGGQ